MGEGTYLGELLQTHRRDRSRVLNRSASLRLDAAETLGREQGEHRRLGEEEEGLYVLPSVARGSFKYVDYGPWN